MASATPADNLQVMQQERQLADTSDSYNLHVMQQERQLADSDAVSSRPALGPARAKIARER